MTELVIVGAGGLGREFAELVEDINVDHHTYHLLGFLDDDPSLPGTEVNGLPVLGGTSWLAHHLNVSAAIAVGNTKVRLKIAGRMGVSGIATPVLCHPTAVIGRTSVIGYGSIVCAGTVITTNAVLGRYVIVNLGSTIGHDAVLHDFVTLAPGVHVSGHVTLEEGVDMGTGSTIIQGRSVGKFTVVGAGAAVVRDLPAGVTAVGVPARPLERK